MLFQLFTFPNGQTAKNRFFKSAMEEQLAQSDKPTQNLVNLYRTWAQGGAGVLVTGNVMINPQGKGSAGDVVVSDERDLPMLKAWAEAGKTDGTLMIMQINHAGKQSPKALNSVPLSPHHNRREDEYGGSLANRMRFLIEVYQGIRATVGKDFLVGVKLNSADFQKGGFDEADSIAVVQKLSEMGIDFVEISGGNYESPEMLSQKASTRKREAFFIDYAHKVRQVSQVPLIITGGFRSQNAMNEALTDGSLDLVGIARPFALLPDLPAQIQHGTYQTLETKRIKTGFAPIDKKAGAMLEMNWYMAQMARIGAGKLPDPKLSAWKVLMKTLWENGKAGLSTGRG